jgi:hypothetical protein
VSCYIILGITAKTLICGYIDGDRAPVASEHRGNRATCAAGLIVNEVPEARPAGTHLPGPVAQGRRTRRSYEKGFPGRPQPFVVEDSG